jgi:hypothetical protein
LRDAERADVERADAERLQDEGQYVASNASGDPKGGKLIEHEANPEPSSKD